MQGPGSEKQADATKCSLAGALTGHLQSHREQGAVRPPFGGKGARHDACLDLAGRHECVPK